MKLNGLTNNLAGNDKSLSNSYLSHIVELLRTEVANLTAKESELEAITTEHIETQKEVVDTKTVNAEKVNAGSITTNSINEKIILTNAVDVLTNLKVNGKDVLTEASFQGPFTYKGVVETLPENANAGDVYISNDKVNIFNGTTWDWFLLPAGTVSLAEYNSDKAEILTEISNAQSGIASNKESIDSIKADTEILFGNVSDIYVKLENKVDEAPKDDNSYVRKNGEWVEQTSADNTVKHTAGGSVIDNSVDGVKIESPKVEITTADFKINGTELPEVDKFGLTKTEETSDDYHYELKFGRSPFNATSSEMPAYCGYNSSAYQTLAKAAPEMFTVFTKNWQYVKWAGANTSSSTSNTSITLTAIDKDGNINLLPNNYVDWTAFSAGFMQGSCFITFNQEYVPEGFDDTVYLFCPGFESSKSTSKAYLIELKDGKFSRKIDIYNGPGKLKEQGFTSAQINVTSALDIGLTGGKGLRNKNINRICVTCFNVAETGGNWVIIIGGDKNSNINDPFDPSKCIYVPLPATTYYGYNCMAATDSAWYLQENSTGRIIRITPNGQVVELNLTETVYCDAFSYIEYTDKNNRPAVAYYVQNTGSINGGHYVLFLEEGENGQVNFTERKITSTAFTPNGERQQHYAHFFKFMENSHYIFFTGDFGIGAGNGSDAVYGSAAMKNMLWYWDKKTHTTHAINNFYEGLTFGLTDFIEMHKTKGNAIWFPYLIQNLALSSATGELKYISDVDYTEIDEETGKDIGEIQVNTASVGTKYTFFIANTKATDLFYIPYTHSLQGDPQQAKACFRNQLSATNDDGILCIISSDAKCIALCYGDGNLKLYPISSNPGIYDCDADKEPYLPDIPYYNAGQGSWNTTQALYGLSHGWVYQVRSNIADISSTDTSKASAYTYIGIKYKNGEPTILEAPRLSKIIGGICYAPGRIKWEKYAYLQTYDDYERRKKVLGEIRANIAYGNAQLGYDGYFKEVRNTPEKLNLTYNNNVISSVEI